MAESVLSVRIFAAIPILSSRVFNSKVLFLRNPEMSQDLIIEALSPFASAAEHSLFA